MIKKFRNMQIIFIFTLLVALNHFSAAQQVPDSIKTKLIQSMNLSEQAWNSGNLEGFMHNYWRSDSLRFITKKGVTYSWQHTLDNYRKGYPDKDAMGRLEFNILSVEFICSDRILMIGKWSLYRKNDTLSGYFSLIWAKIDNDWFIIIDHSS